MLAPGLGYDTWLIHICIEAGVNKQQKRCRLKSRSEEIHKYSRVNFTKYPPFYLRYFIKEKLNIFYQLMRDQATVFNAFELPPLPHSVLRSHNCIKGAGACVK